MASTFINIHAEKVPNPNSIKFTISNFLLTHGAFEYDNPLSAATSPLATKLFGFDYVERVFISKNFVTVTKKAGAVAGESMSIDLRIVIKKHLEKREHIFLTADTSQGQLPARDDSVGERIRTFIDQAIRPATWQDGGDLAFESYENGLVTVSMAGACVGCPFSSRTVKHGVEVILKREFPEVEEVTTLQVDWKDTVQEETPGFDSPTPKIEL